MKNNKLKIYLVVALFLVMGVGYAFLNQDVELDNSVTINNYEKIEWVLPQGKTVSTLEVGDELCRKDQCFNFIKYDGNNVVLLSKYNLNVGHNPKGTETFLQDSGVIGDNSKGKTLYGNVAFSQTNYWYDNENYYIKPQYGTRSANNIYDTNYKTIPDFNANGYSTPGYSIAYYIEKYKQILESNTYRATIENARLLTYQEAYNLDCISSNYACPTSGVKSFVTNTSFWLGSVDNASYIWYVNSNGTYDIYAYNFDYSLGVRPVIIVAKSNI